MSGKEKKSFRAKLTQNWTWPTFNLLQELFQLSENDRIKLTKDTPDKNSAKKDIINKLKQLKNKTDGDLVVDVCIIQRENNLYLLPLSIPDTEDGALTLKEIKDGIATLPIVKPLRSQAVTFKNDEVTQFYNKHLQGKTDIHPILVMSEVDSKHEDNESEDSFCEQIAQIKLDEDAEPKADRVFDSGAGISSEQFVRVIRPCFPKEAGESGY